jgi:hypothetical protein
LVERRDDLSFCRRSIKPTRTRRTLRESVESAAIKKTNPYTPEKRLVMIGGAHTYGVYGAVKAFTFSRRVSDPVARQNCREVVSRLGPDPSFLAVLEVHGIGSSIPTPRLDSGRLWAIPVPG